MFRWLVSYQTIVADPSPAPREITGGLQTSCCLHQAVASGVHIEVTVADYTAKLRLPTCNRSAGLASQLKVNPFASSTVNNPVARLVNAMNKLMF